MTSLTETKQIDQTPPKSQETNLYKILSVPVPEKFLITYNEDGKEFNGYHAQYAIDLLNEVVGLGNWNTNEEILKQETFKHGWAVAMKIEIKFVKLIEGFTITTGYGGAFAKNIANAYKGAKTSAFKNACRYLGIGKELYIQGFEEDISTVEPIVEVPAEGNEIADAIDNADNLGILEQLGESIQQVEGDALKKALIKKYNARKIALMEKK